MKISFVVIGKTSSVEIAKLSDDYVGRIGRYLPFEMRVIADVKNGKSLPNGVLIEREGEAILKGLKDDDFVVLLDDKGKQYTSIEFAKLISDKQNQSVRSLVFVVGGAYGFSKAVYGRANGLISLSKMTFSHQIIRPIFLEQLYRAMTINKGEPYHHEESFFNG